MCFLSVRKTPNYVAYIKGKQSVIWTGTLCPTEADTHFSNVRTAHQLNLAIYHPSACDVDWQPIWRPGSDNWGILLARSGKLLLQCNFHGALRYTLTNLTCTLCCGNLLQTAHSWPWLLALLFLLYLQNLPLPSPSYIHILPVLWSPS